jgi:hypothetical protein
MRLQAIVWTGVLSAALAASDVRLSPRYQTAYVNPMANGLDQYLTSRLTAGRVLWVVLEPANADTVLTDTLDDAFWNWLARTYPPASGATSSNNPRGSALPREWQGSGKNRGTVFLVDPRRRLVLWSTYALPRNSGPAELDRTAAQIANQLRGAFGKK